MLDANKLQQAVDQAYTQFHSLTAVKMPTTFPFWRMYQVNWRQWLS